MRSNTQVIFEPYMSVLIQNNNYVIVVMRRKDKT